MGHLLDETCVSTGPPTIRGRYLLDRGAGGSEREGRGRQGHVATRPAQGDGGGRLDPRPGGRMRPAGRTAGPSPGITGHRAVPRWCHGRRSPPRRVGDLDQSPAARPQCARGRHLDGRRRFGHGVDSGRRHRVGTTRDGLHRQGAGRRPGTGPLVPLPVRVRRRRFPIGPASHRTCAGHPSRPSALCLRVLPADQLRELVHRPPAHRRGERRLPHAPRRLRLRVRHGDAVTRGLPIDLPPLAGPAAASRSARSGADGCDVGRRRVRQRRRQDDARAALLERETGMVRSHARPRSRRPPATASLRLGRTGRPLHDRRARPSRSSRVGERLGTGPKHARQRSVRLADRRARRVHRSLAGHREPLQHQCLEAARPRMAQRARPLVAPRCGHLRPQRGVGQLRARTTRPARLSHLERHHRHGVSARDTPTCRWRRTCAAQSAHRWPPPTWWQVR